MRAAAFGAALVVAGILVVVGVAQIYAPAAYIAAGVLFGLLSWLVLSE